MEGLFFDQWSSLGRTLIAGVIAYVALIALLRVSGKRTLSKWNAFDFIVTVAFGSTLASVIFAKNVSIAQGTLAFAVLVGLQFAVTWLSVRSQTVLRLIKAEPTLLLDRGVFQREAMRRERVVEAEIRAALRAGGVGTIDDDVSVVLETDGEFSVVQSPGRGKTSTLVGVRGYDGPTA